MDIHVPQDFCEVFGILGPNHLPQIFLNILPRMSLGNRFPGHLLW